MGYNLNQNDDFGSFQSKGTSSSGSTVTDINQNPSQSKEAGFGIFQGGSSAPSSGFNPSANVAKPEEDDFGDFQTGKESGTGSSDAAAIQKPKQDEFSQQTAQGFGNFQVGGNLQSKATSSELAGINLFSKTANGDSTSKSISNINTKNLSEIDDFGDFQHSPGPFSTGSNSSTSLTSDSSERLTSSLEKFKLSSNSLPSTQGIAKIPSLLRNDGFGKNSTNINDPEDKKKQESKATVSNFASFPVPGNDPSQTASTAKKSEDKYSAFRDVDFGSGGGVFDVQKPAAKAEDQAADDEFADFGGFEVADQSKPGEDSDFGAFTSTENVKSAPFGVFGQDPQPAKPGNDSDFGAFKSTENVQSAPFGVFDNPQPPQHQPAMSSSNNQDFGNFNSFGGTHLSNPQPKKESSGEFGTFGSFVTGPASANSRSHSHSTTASDSLINSVSLEPSARYKVLSHDSGVSSSSLC